MPELPEVETMVRGIRPFVEGRRLAGMRVCKTRYRPIDIRPRPAVIDRRIRGRRITAVERRGKRVVLRLEGGDVLVIEPRMSGLVLVGEPPDDEHLRVEWRFQDRKQPPLLRFWDRRGLGTVRLYTAQQFEQAVAANHLGPDALGLPAEEWSRRLSRTGRAIKPALLDQSLVAGIGNIYASEILHRARLHPALPAHKLRRSQIRRLAQATDEVLSEAIAYEGSTLGDGTYRTALNRRGRYQNVHRVYGRAGQRCSSCGRGIVRRIVQAQRSTFYCPVCQRLPRRFSRPERT